MAQEGTAAKFRAVGRLPEGIIYPELIHTAMVETLVQNTEAFNAASLNAIRLVTARRMGDFAQESFFKNVTDLVTRRTTNASPDNPAVASNPVPVDENISVKLNRRIGPVDQTFDSFRKLGMNADLEVLSTLLGEQVAKAVQIDQLDAGLNAVVAAITNQSAVSQDVSGASPGTLGTQNLVSTLSQFGDASNRVVIWVMHSKPFFDLVQDQIAANIDGISNFNIASATPVTLNRPVLVTDSASLTVVDTGVSPNQTEYLTLGLTADAVIMEDSEEELLYTDIQTGKDNIFVRMQGEFAYNVQCKGFKWDVANGGINPDDATLGTGSNWDPVMDSFKDFAGVSIRTQ